MTTPAGDADATARVETDVRPPSGPPVRAVQFAPGTMIAARYRIASLLGTGGMGEVYRADDIKLNQPVALKFLPARLARDPILLGRLHEEVRLGRQIAHPNVCRIYDISDWQGSHFVAMEYVDGEDLSRLLRRIGRLAHDKAVDIARGIAAGLMAAHAKGILHRDLKPANVMIDSRGDARIMDFGLALSDDEDDGTISGTPAYMAPEQLKGAPATVQSDLYSLGLVMYELFTGKRAYNVRTLPERVRELSTEIASPSTHIRDLDADVERIILRCVHNDPLQRPASAREVIHALPGGDPLAAALAAGETPSPRIVAAAGTEGRLKPSVAWSMLGAIVVLMALMFLRASDGHPLQTWGLGTPPELQRVRAMEHLQRLGIPEQRFRSYGFEEKLNYHAWVYVNGKGPERWSRFSRGLPRVSFWLREEPRPMIDTLPEADNLRPDRLRPPQLLPGSSMIELDARGRIVELNVIPSESWPPRAFDWNTLLDAAGLRNAALVPATPQTLPQSFADARAAWTGKHPDDGTPIRVEAATLHGVPVSFRILAPWDAKNLRPEVPFGGEGFNAFIGVVSLCVLAFGGLLAWRNIRLRRGDRQGAIRIGVTLLVLNTAVLLLTAQHAAVARHELLIAGRAVSRALLSAVLFALLYIAVEPYVRRRWPDRLISWARLVGGNWRDPMIGRDILIGMIAGLVHSCITANTRKLIALVTGEHTTQPFTGDIQQLSFPTGSLSRFINAVSTGIPTALLMMALLVILTIVLRRRSFATAGVFAVFFTAFLFASDEPSTLVPLMFVAAIYATVISRFGMLAMAAMQTTFAAICLAPLPDAMAWYTTRAMISPLLTLALALWAFSTSLGDQHAFAALDD